jgi:hypothetical protein
MNEPSVSVLLDRQAFEPGDTLEGSYQVVAADLGGLEEVEITVGWHTEGEGIEARGVEHREIHRPGDGSLGRDGAGKFTTVLPGSPLSYDGLRIKVCWTVNVCAGFSGSRQVISESAFRLGHVARPGAR